MQDDVCDICAYNSAIKSMRIVSYTCMTRLNSYSILQDVGIISDWVMLCKSSFAYPSITYVNKKIFTVIANYTI